MLQRHHPVRLAAALVSVLALAAPLVVQGAGAPMTTAPMKANGSGIEVQYRVDGAPQAGRPVSVLLSFAGVADPAGATVRLATDGGLSLAGSETQRSLAAGQATTWTVDVVPPATGIGYLHVFTTQSGTTSVTSVPVGVEKPASAMPGGDTLKQGAGGEKILPMKVK